MNNIITGIKKYTLNCFLLTLPVMVWNIFLANDLPISFQPEIFWNKIPSFITVGEQVSRVAVFAFTVLMPLSITSEVQRKGIVIYLIGILIYFGSWLALIYYPESKWSSSCFGFLSPAYTPLLWLIGIALIGNKFYFNLPYKKWMFIALSIVFFAVSQYPYTDCL